MTEVVEEGQYTTIHPKVHAHDVNSNEHQGWLVAFGEKGNEAILKELRQLHQKKVLLPVMKENLTYDKR